jgi:hypothetical protein
MEFLDLVEKWWLKATILLLALGFFVHNVYLMKFGFIEFDLLQTRYIYSGFATLLYFTLLIIYVSLRLHFDDAKANFTPVNFLVWSFRFPILVFILVRTLFPDQQYLERTISTYFGGGPTEAIVGTLATLTTLYLSGIVLLSVGVLPNPPQSLVRPFKILFAFFCIPFLILLVLAARLHPDVQRVLWFAVSPFFLILGYLNGRLDAQRGDPLTPAPIQSKDAAFVRKFWRQVYAFLVLAVAASWAFSYSQIIYPRLPANFGGIRPVQATIITDVDTLKTRIVYENSQWLLLESPDSLETIRLRRDLVKRIFHHE